MSKNVLAGLVQCQKAQFLNQTLLYYQVKLISLEANAEAQSHEVKTLQEKHHVSSIQETILKSKALEMERRSEMLEKQLEELLLQPDVQRTDNKDSSEQQAAAEVVGESSVHLQATMIERDDLKKQLHQAQSAIAQMEVSPLACGLVREVWHRWMLSIQKQSRNSSKSWDKRLRTMRG